MRYRFLPALALALAACQAPEAPRVDATSAPFSADSIVAAMERAVNAGQADTVAAGYLEDGVHVNRDTLITGREGIANFWRVPEGATAEMDLEVDNEVVSGDLAYAEGTWTQRFTPPGGQEMTASGNWAGIYRHTEDGWKVYRSMSYIPRGTAAAAPTR
jgi:uncharacterized protein (TIGR02246 family)